MPRGDIIEIGMEVVKLGKTSITVLHVMSPNKRTEQTITSVDSIVFVNLGPDGKPARHGKNEVQKTRRK